MTETRTRRGVYTIVWNSTQAQNLRQHIYKKYVLINVFIQLRKILAQLFVVYLPQCDRDKNEQYLRTKIHGISSAMTVIDILLCDSLQLTAICNNDNNELRYCSDNELHI